jgi:2-hydroxymuconate-semialdehyde hydrolase
LDSDSFSFEGLRVAYEVRGAGAPLLLLHGSGPGASSLGNWRTVLPALAERFTVHTVDLVGFGRSDRKSQAPYFDYPLWVRQAEAMLARIGGDGPVGIIGHSLSGAIALTLASRQRRVAAVMTTGSMGASFTPNDATHRTWRCPRNRDELRRAIEGLVHDASRIDDAYLDAREPVVFAPDYADYFDTMFGGDQQRYIDAAVLSPDVLAAIRCPVLMLHGRDDTAFPASVSLEVSKSIADADVVLLARCSHSVAFEHPSKFVAAANAFFDAHLRATASA